MLAVLIYSHRFGYLPLLEWQLKQAGIDQKHIVDSDFSWRRRVLHTRDAARLYRDELLIFPDAWDTVLLGTKDEILTLELAGEITVAGAKNCWPDDRAADYAAKQNGITSPWRYVNTNPLAGLGRDIAEAIDWGWARFPLMDDTREIEPKSGEVDERFWTSLYLDSPCPVNIDSDCRLSQSFISTVPGELRAEGGRIYNEITGSKPVFFHLNGNHLLPEGLVKLQ